MSAELVENLTLGLIRASARYAVDRNMGSYNDLVGLAGKVTAASDGAAADEEGAKFEPVYWRLLAAKYSAEAQLTSNQDFKRFKADDGGAMPRRLRASRLNLQPPPGSCALGPPSFQKPVAYPAGALDNGVAGAVIVKVDVEASFAVNNNRILAAVPQRYFGDAVMGAADSLKFTKSADAPADCALAQKDEVFTYIFQIGR